MRVNRFPRGLPPQVIHFGDLVAEQELLQAQISWLQIDCEAGESWKEVIVRANTIAIPADGIA